MELNVGDRVQVVFVDASDECECETHAACKDFFGHIINKTPNLKYGVEVSFEKQPDVNKNACFFLDKELVKVSSQEERRHF
jgi:hypothetical protein